MVLDRRTRGDGERDRSRCRRLWRLSLLLLLPLLLSPLLNGGESGGLVVGGCAAAAGHPLASCFGSSPGLVGPCVGAVNGVPAGVLVGAGGAFALAHSPSWWSRCCSAELMHGTGGYGRLAAKSYPPSF